MYPGTHDKLTQVLFIDLKLHLVQSKYKSLGFSFSLFSFDYVELFFQIAIFMTVFRQELSLRETNDVFAYFLD